MRIVRRAAHSFDHKSILKKRWKFVSWRCCHARRVTSGAGSGRKAYGERWFVSTVDLEGFGMCVVFGGLQLRQECRFGPQAGGFSRPCHDVGNPDGSTAEDRRATSAVSAEFVATNAIGNGRSGFANERPSEGGTGSSERSPHDASTDGKTQSNHGHGYSSRSDKPWPDGATYGRHDVVCFEVGHDKLVSKGKIVANSCFVRRTVR